ncbi:MAG: DUF697 domain-containing protein [Leptolyngbya sp. SIO4C5]|nr:DUF697 domain-containing protein [Leptolyngbya sp. SIO4C5]
MTRWLRFLLIAISILLVLGMLIWLVEAFSRLYYGIALWSPLLANLVVWALLLLLLLALGGTLYYSYLFLRPKRRRSPPIAPPRTKTEAAQVSLQAVQQQVAQIQDQVARQAILARSQAISASLNQGELHIVVFGTGSAGKTSIVNALLGERVGQVGAPMGTTAVGATYRLAVPTSDWQVLLTDTPGLLEAGVAGTEREQQAKQLATEANLLLFVIDDDLRQSEFELLRSLAAIGKRSLLVFNKIDRYPEADLAQLLARLRQRLRGIIAPDDLIPVAANPQSFRLEDGTLWQPEPEIWPLLQRLAALLRQEGAILIADNILLQAQRLSEEARQLIAQQRQAQADAVIDRYQWLGAGAIAAMPLPGIDLLATAAVNAQMVVELGRVYGCEVTLAEGKELAFSLAKTLTSLGIVKGAMQLLSVGMQVNIATALASRAIQGASAAYLTRIAGKSFVEYFRQNQDWGDGGIGEVVQQQFQLNRRDAFIKAFVQEAIAKVVAPLRESPEEP